MPQTVKNLVSEIHSDLGDAVTGGNWVKGTTDPHAGNSCPVDVNKDIGQLTNTELKEVVTFAVKSKWTLDAAVNVTLKVKGGEMVKRITGLEATEQD